MVDENGYEWGVEVDVVKVRAARPVTEQHRHYSEESARVALYETERRIQRGIGKATAVRLIRRPVGQWEAVQ